MNIYAKKGDKVINSNLESGRGFDREMADRHLEPNAIYTVERTDVGGWSTRVYLKEVPGKPFNSVLFEDFETEV